MGDTSRKGAGRRGSEKVQERKSEDRKRVAGILGFAHSHMSLVNPGRRQRRELSAQLMRTMASPSWAPEHFTPQLGLGASSAHGAPPPTGPPQ